MKIDKNVLVKFLDLMFDEDTSDPYVLYENYIIIDMYKSHKYFDSVKKLSDHRNIIDDMKIVTDSNLTKSLKMAVENNFLEFDGLEFLSTESSSVFSISLEFENNDVANRVVEIYHAVKNLIDAGVVIPIDSSFKEDFADRINDGTIL